MAKQSVEIDVIVICKNHENFIESCLKSIIAQKKIDILNLVIVDDGSSDNTVDKINNFILENRNSKIIINLLTNLETKLNQEGYNPIKVGSNFFKFNYFAILEGDDYWIDDEKLIKQYELLEENKSIVGCHTLAIRKRESLKFLHEQTRDLLPTLNTRKESYGLKDFIYENGVITGTVLLRTSIFNKIKKDISNIQPGDWFIFALMSQYGDFLLYKRVTMVYRIHENNFWVAQSQRFRLEKSISLVIQLSKEVMGHDEIFNHSISTKIKILNQINDSKINSKSNKLINKVLFSNQIILHLFFLILYLLNLKYCIICQSTFKKFRPLDNKFIENLIKYGWDLPFDDSEMCNVQEYHCPTCDSSDRNRFYAFWMLFNKNKFKFETLLDIAPDEKLSEFITKFIKPKTYIKIDLFLDNVDLNVDIQDLHTFPNNIFDFIICSHVLEHVDNDVMALLEINRVLSSNGKAILVAPISLSLSKTREDKNITNPTDRWKFFGQDDHVRHYAKNDFIKRILTANFKLSLFNLTNTHIFIYNVLGLSTTATLYIGGKDE